MFKTTINKVKKIRTFFTVIKEYERGVKLNFGKFHSFNVHRIINNYNPRCC